MPCLIKGIDQMMSRNLFLSILLTTLFVASCTPQKNIVKVLNRVICKPGSLDTCSQETIDGIWNLCLKNGYKTKIPDDKVISSRDLYELVDGSVKVSYLKQNTTDETDANGIVTEAPATSTIESYNRKISGYCIGSEYITN